MRALSLVLACAALAGCTEADPAPEAAPDPVVARQGDVEVRQSAFADEYQRFASLAPVQDGLDARRDYARLMLERAYIARLGAEAGLADRPEVEGHVERRRRFAMRRQFLTDTLGALIDEPTEADVREAFRRQNTRLRVWQAFAPTEAEARVLRDRLGAGEPFEAVAQASMRAVGLEATGEMGWVTFNDLDEAPEDVLFGLDRGEVSAPVRSLRGWHVFQILDVEETVRLDASAYASARERLAFEVRQRRLDEAGAQVLRPLLESHELAVDLAPLRALWPSVAPLVPDRGEVEVLAAARSELPALRPEAVSRSTPVAMVDGAPFTVGQLLDALPDVPVEHWTPDLRKAVEVAVRDSILTARAEAYADAPAVVQEAEAARRTALYYATLAAAADTVRLDRHVERFYDLWRDDALVAERTTAFSAWPFATREAARDALARANAGADWDALAAEAGVVPEARAASGPPGERGPFGVHTLPAASGLVGPFPEAGRFWVVRVTGRADRHVPLAEARADVLAVLEAEPRAALHQLLLDGGFVPEAVSFDDGALRDALPLATSPTET